MDDVPTRALRVRSPDLLREGLKRVLVEGEQEWLKDWRDLLVVLAPYHDCAQRLGLDPVVLFDEAAEVGPPSLQHAVREFGRRQDVTPDAFGFELVADADGPRYRWVP